MSDKPEHHDSKPFRRVEPQADDLADDPAASPSPSSSTPETPVPDLPDGGDAAAVDPAGGSAASGAQVSGQVDSAQIAHFVTTIKNAEQQVGENIIRALQHSDTVAVLTTVAMSPDGQQRVVSAALNPSRLQQVQEILMAAELERQEEEPCVGFHCLVKPKSDASQMR